MPHWNVTGVHTRIWLMRGFGAVGVVLLASVPALGLTMLTPGLFISRPAAEKASPSDPEVAVSYAPLTFDAPTTTLQSMKASEPGSRPQSSAGRASLLPLNRLQAGRPQVSGAAAPKAEEVVIPASRFTPRLLPVTPQQSSAPLASNVGPAPSRATGEKITSSGANLGASGGTPVLGGPTQQKTISGGGPLQTAQKTSNTQTFASPNQTSSLDSRQMRTQRSSPGTQLEGLDGPLEPLDSDLSKRKPRKHRHSPHH